MLVIAPGHQVLSLRVGLNRSSSGLTAHFGSDDDDDDDLPHSVAFAGIVGYGSPEDDLGVPTLKSVLALELKFLVDPLSLLLLARNLAVAAPDVNRRSSSYVCDDAELRFL
ncbi:hypothetical protein Nepgr_015817 [Nepenthes gracilis]|uniref:Uncharacterized protein n=1 Tax=Nepenthes gracilis TaxID=150966 RepID=A0AAD3SPA5_NEPGR|nr:hypothetical protein Nepgr_015817 [Nepenthes gracilis]